jgi:hypothetical protein
MSVTIYFNYGSDLLRSVETNLETSFFNFMTDLITTLGEIDFPERLQLIYRDLDLGSPIKFVASLEGDSSFSVEGLDLRQVEKVREIRESFPFAGTAENPLFLAHRVRVR